MESIPQLQLSLSFLNGFSCQILWWALIHCCWVHISSLVAVACLLRWSAPKPSSSLLSCSPVCSYSQRGMSNPGLFCSWCYYNLHSAKFCSFVLVVWLAPSYTVHSLSSLFCKDSGFIDVHVFMLTRLFYNREAKKNKVPPLPMLQLSLGG